MTRSWPLVAGIVLCLGAATAQANGRFPQSISVHVQPDNDQLILLGVTFGLLISEDGGETFRWVCEDAIGYGGRFDPDYAITADGTIYATTFEGLRVSLDRGCTWVNPPDLVEHWVEEVEVGPDGRIWVGTASDDRPNDVYMSTDNGESFQAMNVPQDAVFWKTLRVAPSDPQRLYVTGYRVAEALGDGGLSGPEGYLYRSDDGGQTWTPLDLASVELGSQAWFFLLGVAPDNPDVVFARSVGANEPGGDLLYRSTDGGETWAEVLQSTDAIEAFVIRTDGDIIAGTDEAGVHISKDGGATWATMSLPRMKCVAETSAGDLLACGANWEPDFFALGRSSDGVAWDKIFRFSEMAAALSCPAGTVQYDICEAQRWPATCEMFGCARADAGLPVDAGVDAGSGTKGGGGCCDASPRSAHSSAVLAALVALMLMLMRRSAVASSRR